MQHPATNEKYTQHAQSARICGECDVCCTAMHVAALDKPAGMRCEYLRDSGCGNYENRPAACRDWYCMWLRDRTGIFSEDERPDRVGVFLTATTPTATGRQVVIVHPVRPDAMSQPAAQRLVQRLKRYVPVQVLPFHGEAASLTHEGRPVACA